MYTKQRKNVYRYFLYPAIFLMALLIVVPLVYAVYISFNNLNLMQNQGKMTFAGLANYLRLFSDPTVKSAALVTIKLLVFALSAELIFGILIALLLDRKFRGKGLVRSIILVPMFMATVVAGMAWRAMMDPLTGFLQWVLGGTRIDFLGSPDLALLSVAFVDVWQWTPFMVVMFMSSLDSVSNEIYEAAAIDGASELQIIRRIKIPLIVDTIAISLILRGLEVLKVFSTLYMMTSGGPGTSTMTFNMYAYIQGFSYYNLGYATTIALVFTVVVSVILGFAIYHLQKKHQLFGV